MEATSVLEAFLLTEAQSNPLFPFDEVSRAWKQIIRPSTKLPDLGNSVITNRPSEAASTLFALEQILCELCSSNDVHGVRRRLRIAILGALEADLVVRSQNGAQDSATRPKRMHVDSSAPQQSPRKRRLDGLPPSRLVSLPTELVARICSLLDLHSQTALACTCRTLRAVAETLLSREPVVVVRRAVTHTLALCDTLPPASRAGALQEVSLALELEARLCYARTELQRRAELVHSGAMFRLEYASLQESQRKEMLRLARGVGLQMAYLYHMQPADPLQEDDVRLSSQQVETVRNLSQAVPPAMDEAERGWFDWHAFPLHKREGWDPASVHVLRVFFTIGDLPVIVEVIGPWSTTLAMANEIRIFSGGTGGRRELVVIFSRIDGIDRHRWPRVAPLFAPLNTALAPPQLCLFILLASTITEEGGFPNWLQGLLQEWEHEST